MGTSAPADAPMVVPPKDVSSVQTLQPLEPLPAAVPAVSGSAYKSRPALRSSSLSLNLDVHLPTSALRDSSAKDRDNYESSELSDLGEDDSEAETDKMDFLDDDANAALGEKMSDLRRISHLTELARVEGVNSDDSDEGNHTNDNKSLQNSQPCKSSESGPQGDGVDSTIFQSFRTDLSDTEEQKNLKRAPILHETDLMLKPVKKLRVHSNDADSSPLLYSPIPGAIETPKSLHVDNYDNGKNPGSAPVDAPEAVPVDNGYGRDEEESVSSNANGISEEPNQANGQTKTKALEEEAVSDEPGTKERSNGSVGASDHETAQPLEHEDDEYREKSPDAKTMKENQSVSSSKELEKPKLEDDGHIEEEETPEDNAANELANNIDTDTKSSEYIDFKEEEAPESVENNSELSLNFANSDESEDTPESKEVDEDAKQAQEQGRDFKTLENEKQPLEEPVAEDAEDDEAEKKEEEVDLDLDEHRKAAISELVSIEKDFSLLRDKYYNDKLALLEHEMELCLDGSHPELLLIYCKLNEHYQQNIKISNATLNYSLKCINTETIASRTSIHQDFMKNLTDMKNEMVAETTSLWYKINRERNYLDQIVPDFNFTALPSLNPHLLNMAIVAGGGTVEYYRDVPPPSKKAINQSTIIELVLRRNEFNEQLGVLNGLMEFHGFPSAVSNSLLDDDVCSVNELLLRKATAEEVNEDLRAMGIY